ncbi:hypothetical protein H7K45_10210 [Mycobacterium yunnanensis]|uniref:Uncharacterized protein n=1 Tax=Mycobacterium yunnanensis TaxID=368477 RepID=A0A9X2Z104_9MYCO|nr:hypothetical protein [Mycobacterium yunnanensis]MCV7420911.1 hypothetical protein [Mycobacterium yunnanensis]
MAFTLTYSDGQETDYDDDTAWEVDDGVLKMGRRDGEWSVYVSPSHWAVLEVGGRRSDDEKESKGKSDDSDEDSDDSDESDDTDVKAEKPDQKADDED